MTSYHWNAGYRETRELPPQKDTQAEREVNTKNAKRASSRAHTDSATAFKKNSAKLIHTPMRGQTKHAQAHKDKTACAVGQAAQVTLRKRVTV